VSLQGECEATGSGSKNGLGGGWKWLRQEAVEAIEQHLPGRVDRTFLPCNLQRNGQVRLAGDANLTAHQPIDVSTELSSGGRFQRGIGAQGHGEEDFIFVAKIHQRAKRQAARCGKLHGSGGDAGWERPLDARRLARVACVDPVDVPAFVQGEVQSNLLAAARLDRTLQRK
jgi:hypothetical protein